jgi:hypothetical protein
LISEVVRKDFSRQPKKKAQRKREGDRETIGKIKRDNSDLITENGK